MARNDSLSDVGRQKLQEMFSMVDDVNIDDIKTDGFTVRSGNKLLKINVVDIEPLSIETEIREELKIKLREKLQEIKVRLSEKIDSVIQMTDTIKIEAEIKEKELKERLANAKPMPHITKEHAKKGISCVKGNGKDEMIWLVYGVYWPKFVKYTDKDTKKIIVKAIDKQYHKKMATPVIFKIETKGNSITSINTCTIIGLKPFPHYHLTSSGSDCWGKWGNNRKKKWTSVDDLIKLGKDAEAVLETINIDSIATHNPKGLPREESLMNHLVSKKLAYGGDNGLTVDQTRMGISSNMREDDDDVWSL